MYYFLENRQNSIYVQYYTLPLLYMTIYSIILKSYVSFNFFCAFNQNFVIINPIQTGFFLVVPGLGGGASNAPPLRFLKTIKDRDMKLTPLIKRREINLLLLKYFSCDVTWRH